MISMNRLHFVASCFRPSARTGKGFTLVELLVTITIIIVIASLAFLGARSVRDSANMTTSMKRIKNLGLANAAYAADHGGRYVPIISIPEEGVGVQWHYNAEFLGFLAGDLPVLRGVIKDRNGIDGLPEELLDPVTVKAKQKDWSRLSGSYGYNQENIPGGYAWSRGTKAQQTTSTIANPSRNFNFITATDWLVRHRGRFDWLKNPVEGKTSNGQIAYRYKGKAIAVFYDGHTELISPGDIEVFDTRGQWNNVFWGGTK